MKPRGPITGASTAGWLKPLAAPLWLALQPYANARLCLFEVDRPESRNPIPIRRHRGRLPLPSGNPAGEHQQHL